MSEKPSKTEDEYFAREDAEKLHRLHADKLKTLSEQEREQRKQLHHMHCPKCGHELETIKWRGVSIEKCFDCGAVVLDDGELETLAGKENDESFLTGLYDLFRGKD